MRTNAKNRTKIRTNIKKLKAFVLSMVLVSSFVFAKPTHAAICDNFDYRDPSLIDIMCPIIGVINILVIGAGGVFVAMVAMGAIKYGTSLGDPKAAMSAQGTITYAVIGLVAAAGLFVIFQLIGNIFGFDSTLFSINGIYDSIAKNICDFFSEGSTRGAIVEFNSCANP